MQAGGDIQYATQVTPEQLAAQEAEQRRKNKMQAEKKALAAQEAEQRRKNKMQAEKKAAESRAKDGPPPGSLAPGTFGTGVQPGLGGPPPEDLAPGTFGTSVQPQQQPDFATYYDDQGNLRNLELDKAVQAGQTELSPDVDKQTQDILKMSTGVIEPDLQFDLNKDGKITSADALQFATDAKTQADAERARQAEIDSLNARLQELQATSTKDTTQPPGTERPIIQPGTPDPAEAPKEIGELDDAQKAYADAQKSLTDAQAALNDFDVDTIEFQPFESEEDKQTIQTDYLDKALSEYGIGMSATENVDPVELKALLESGKLPEDPTDFEITGSKENWVINYPNGQKITVRRADKDKVANDKNGAAGIADLINAFKESDTYKNKPKSESEQEYANVVEAVDTANDEIEKTKMELTATESRAKVTGVPSLTETLAKTISSPKDLVTRPDVYGIKVEDNQFIDADTGQVAKMEDLIAKQAELADATEAPSVKASLAYLGKLSDAERLEKYGPEPKPSEPEKLAEYQARIAQDAVKDLASTYEATMSQDNIKRALSQFSAQTGTPSEKAIMEIVRMDPNRLAQLNLDAATQDSLRQIKRTTLNYTKGEYPDAARFREITKSDAAQITDPERRPDIDAARFATDTPRAKAAVDYNLPPTQYAEQEASKVEDAANFPELASAEEKQTEYVPDVTGEETAVGDKEIVDINKIINTEPIIVVGKTFEGLNEDAKAKAQTASFTQALEAKFTKGRVSAQSTITFQLEKLMDSFNDGTPAWAAGAMRNVNEAMNARGMGGSSMAAAALLQAAMETTLPIAQAEASIFQAMDMENVRNKQAVALANAAAAQRFELQNLDNKQAAAIQNSMNSANLQFKNLSNLQEAVLAQAQLRAGLQNITLGAKENVAVANAARYAEVNDINLTNRQQASILESSQNLEVDLANLSNRQQTALSNLQVKASMMGQNLTNEQQMAVLQSTQTFDRQMEDANRKQQAFIQDAAAMAALEGRVLDNRQQTSLFNVSSQLQEREIELNNEQQTRMFNMTNKLNIDVENLSNRQQTALANAQIEAAMKGQELTNKQQVNVIKAERIAEIANMNFTAETSRVMRNSELAQTVDLANLSNRQAKLMSDAAALTQVDLANLSNSQQRAQQKASAFLQMDVQNLSNEQQMEIFKAQQTTQSIFTDQAADNAAKQFNAESENQMTQFTMNLDAQVDMFNQAQENAMNQFNTGEENTIAKFNQELTNQRDMFNASNELVVAQANTQWRKDIATIENAAVNEANMNEAMAANNLTLQGIAEVWQEERDLMNYAWTTAEKQADRDFELLKADIQKDADEDTAFAMAAGNFLSATIGAVGEAGSISKFFS
jgi:hypothetical protein